MPAPICRGQKIRIAALPSPPPLRIQTLLIDYTLYVVVDAVVRHWLRMAAQEAERRGERGRERRHQAALFYADNGMLASSDPRWL